MDEKQKRMLWLENRALAEEQGIFSPVIEGSEQREPCCQLEWNLYVASVEKKGDAVLTLRRCRVCNRRHFEAEVPAIHIGVKGAAL